MRTVEFVAAVHAPDCFLRVSLQKRKHLILAKVFRSRSAYGNVEIYTKQEQQPWSSLVLTLYGGLP